jgi:hypothetical protein
MYLGRVHSMSMQSSMLKDRVESHKLDESIRDHISVHGVGHLLVLCSLGVLGQCAPVYPYVEVSGVLTLISLWMHTQSAEDCQANSVQYDLGYIHPSSVSIMALNASTRALLYCCVSSHEY